MVDYLFDIIFLFTFIFLFLFLGEYSIVHIYWVVSEYFVLLYLIFIRASKKYKETSRIQWGKIQNMDSVEGYLLTDSETSIEASNFEPFL